MYVHEWEGDNAMLGDELHARRDDRIKAVASKPEGVALGRGWGGGRLSRSMRIRQRLESQSLFFVIRERPITLTARIIVQKTTAFPGDAMTKIILVRASRLFEACLVRTFMCLGNVCRRLLSDQCDTVTRGINTPHLVSRGCLVQCISRV